MSFSHNVKGSFCAKTDSTGAILVIPQCYFRLKKNVEYTDDGALIPKNSSVIIRRIPIGGVKAASKTFVMQICVKSSMSGLFLSVRHFCSVLMSNMYKAGINIVRS
uniref:DWNN domain-containing protein n=1 Tax=Pygocentrus nattereri TaxID=42514 RepID=A0AAR2K7R5_PYGNA